MRNWELLAQLIGGAKVVDLSPTIEHNMPKWPTHPQIIVDPTITHAHDGYYCQTLVMGEHTGAHVDCPAHILPEMQDKTVDTYEPNMIMGPAVKYDMYRLNAQPGDRITKEQILELEDQMDDRARPGDIVLLDFGYQQYWKLDNTWKYYALNEPGLSQEACALFAERQIRAIGSDTIACDTPVKDGYEYFSYGHHDSFLPNEIFIMDIPIDANAKVGTLSAAMKQFISIARVLYRKPRVIVFDEPTAVLSDSEVHILMDIIDSLKQEKVTIIYISHRMDEIFQLSDRITIMRDGAVITVLENKNLTKDNLISHMLGKTLGAMYVTRGKIRSERYVLEVVGLTNDAIKDVSFKLREGEILGIAGLVNSGRTETARAIMGADKLKSGTIKINGTPVKIKNPTDAVRHGLFLAPEDRKKQAMVLCRPIRENISLSKLSSVTNRLGILNSKKEAETIDNLVRALKVKMDTIESPVQDLSGGNQQKIVIAKAITARPNILIFDEPTQGIDVGARAEIYGLLEKLRADGKSIILISSETEEIQGTCDRTIVMRSGHVTGELNAEEMKDTKLMLQYMYKDV